MEVPIKVPILFYMKSSLTNTSRYILGFTSLRAEAYVKTTLRIRCANDVDKFVFWRLFQDNKAK